MPSHQFWLEMPLVKTGMGCAVSLRKPHRFISRPDYRHDRVLIADDDAPRGDPTPAAVIWVRHSNRAKRTELPDFLETALGRMVASARKASCIPLLTSPSPRIDGCRSVQPMAVRRGLGRLPSPHRRRSAISSVHEGAVFDHHDTAGAVVVRSERKAIGASAPEWQTPLPRLRIAGAHLFFANDMVSPAGQSVASQGSDSPAAAACSP